MNTSEEYLRLYAGANEEFCGFSVEEGDSVSESGLTGEIIGAAMEVHKALGPGLLESIYVKALRVELDLRTIPYAYQVPITSEYKGVCVGEFRIDLIVDNAVVVELKAVERFEPVMTAQLLSYMRLTNTKTGLLINFNSQLLHKGIKTSSVALAA